MSATSSAAAAAAPAAPVSSNNFSDIEKKRNYALLEKRICEVAFALIPVLAGAILFSGALALPHASFLLSTGLPLAVLLIAKLYFKTLGRVEEYGRKLSFEILADRMQSRPLAYVDRALNVYTSAKREIESLDRLFKPAVGSSMKSMNEYGDAIQSHWDKIEEYAFHDIVCAILDLNSDSGLKNGGTVTYPQGTVTYLRRAHRLEQDGLRAKSNEQPSPYFTYTEGGGTISFQAIEQLLDQWYQAHGSKFEAEEPQSELLEALKGLVPPQTARAQA